MMLGILMVLTIMHIDYDAHHQVMSMDYRLIRTTQMPLAECEKSAYDFNITSPLMEGNLSMVCAPDITVPFTTKISN